MNIILIKYKYFIKITTKCQTYSGELTQENTERTVESADNAPVKWVLSANTTLCSAENALEKVLISLDSPRPDDHCIKHIISNVFLNILILSSKYIYHTNFDIFLFGFEYNWFSRRSSIPTLRNFKFKHKNIIIFCNIK